MLNNRPYLAVVPAYNEEGTVARVSRSILDAAPDFDVLVVDDGSTDRTAEVAKEYGAEVLSFEANRGLPAAIAGGYGYAVEHDYAFTGRVDADGQHPAEELRRLLERVRAGTCDVAVGSRFVSGDGYEPWRYESSVSRRVGTGVLRRSMGVALRRPFHDATSGMYAANAKALPVLARPYDSEAPEVQALLRLHDEGFRVDEVPVHMRQRAGGESKLRGKKALMVVLTVAGTLLSFEALRRTRGRR